MYTIALEADAGDVPYAAATQAQDLPPVGLPPAPGGMSPKVPMQTPDGTDGSVIDVIARFVMVLSPWRFDGCDERRLAASLSVTRAPASRRLSVSIISSFMFTV